jgi:hypothetical protein
MRLLTLAAAVTFCAAAQSPSDPPPLLQLIRIPLGSKMARAYANAKAPVDVLGLTAMTGSPETWLIETHQTFASIEDLDRALGTALPAGPANQYGEATDELLGGRVR